MSPENFVYWLQGAFEITGITTLDTDEVQVVKDHLALVLKKETPEYNIQTPVVTAPVITQAPSTLDWVKKLQEHPQMPAVTC